MQKDFAKSVLMILGAVDIVAKTVAEGGKEAEFNEKTGRVWEFCNATTGLPKSNKIAVKRKMMSEMKTVKDMSREFQEIADDAEIIESREGDGEVAASGEKQDPSTFEFDQAEYDDFMMGGESMTKAEHTCLTGCIKVLSMTEFLLKRSVKELALLDTDQAKSVPGVSAITAGAAAATIEEGDVAKADTGSSEETIFDCSAGGSSSSSFDKTRWGESLAIESEHIGALAVELGVALYPPHSNEKIVAELTKCDVAAGKMFDILISSPWIQGDEHKKQRMELETGKKKMRQATEGSKPTV
jgi:hypothetical protein